jgi:hypothetical protein
MGSSLLTIAAAIALTGCATAGHAFQDIPAQGAPRMRVMIDHRLATAAEVKAICYMKFRESGAAGVTWHYPNAPGCSWEENGVQVVLCTTPRSFNDLEALESCGHEDLHRHNIIDHK